MTARYKKVEPKPGFRDRVTAIFKRKPKAQDTPVNRKHRRILIVRLSAIGDTIHSLPLAAALRQDNPDCYIGWVVEKPSAPLVVGNPIVDWVHVLPKGWLKKPSLVRDVVRRVKARRFDSAIDVHGLFKSAVIPWLAGIKTRVGFNSQVGRELAPLLDNVRIAPKGKHVIENSLGLLSGIDIEAKGIPELILPPTPKADREAIDAFLANEDYAGGFHLFGPFTSNLSKNWPLERFADLALLLLKETGLPSLALWHGKEERESLEEAIEGRAGALRPAPEVSILGVAELERRAALFVGCDSFPLHMAAGLGRPCLGLFGVSDPARVGPHLKFGREAHQKLTLTTSSKQRAKMGQANMKTLAVEKVFGVCKEILEEVRAEKDKPAEVEVVAEESEVAAAGE